MKRTPAKITIHKSNDGLRRFIMINGKRYIYARWLFEKEVRPLKPGEIIHHDDEDKLNDCIENYRAINPSEHKAIHNKGNKYKLGKKMSEETKRKLSIAHTGKKLSKEHRLKISISGKGRKHSKETKKIFSEKRKGENNPSAILTQKEVDEIRHRYYWIKDISTYKLANLYRVHQSTINDIIQGRNWNPNKLTKEKLIEKAK